MKHARYEELTTLRTTSSSAGFSRLIRLTRRGPQGNNLNRLIVMLKAKANEIMDSLIQRVKATHSWYSNACLRQLLKIKIIFLSIICQLLYVRKSMRNRSGKFIGRYLCCKRFIRRRLK